MKLVLARDAEKSLGRLPVSVRANFIARLKAIAADPAGLKHHRHLNVKDFGAGKYRLRVTKWRAVFQVTDEAMVVTVIDKREDVYR